MLLSMDILAAELQNLCSWIRLTENTKMNLEGVRFSEADNTCLSLNHVYIMENTPSFFIENTNLILLKNVPREIIPESVNILVLQENISSMEVYNRILETIQKYNDWYLTLHQLLEQNAPYIDFLDISQPIFKAGISLMDWNHNAIAVTDTEMENCPLWDAIQNGYGYKYRYIIEHSNPKLSVLTKMKTMSQNWSNIDRRYLYNVPLFMNGQPVFGIGLHKVEDPEVPFGKHITQLLEIFSNIMLRRLNEETNMSRNHNNLYDIFINDVIKGDQANADAINRQNQYMIFDPEDHLILVMIDFPTMKYRSDILRLYSRELEMIMDESWCAIYESRILWIVNAKKITHFSLLSQFILSNVERWLQKRNAICAISPSFQSLSLLKIRYRQAYVTLQLGQIDKTEETRMHDYFDFLHLHMIVAASAAVDVTSLVHPVLQKLINYDQEHNSTYYETFKIYLLECMDLTFNEIAEKMHVHRNTLHYRLEKIQEIIQCNYELAELRRPLLWSIYCIDLYPSIYQHNILPSDES